MKEMYQKRLDTQGFSRTIYCNTIPGTDFVIYDDVRLPLGNNELYNIYGPTIRRGIVHEYMIEEVFGIEPIAETVILPYTGTEAAVYLFSEEDYDAVLSGKAEIADVAVRPSELKAGCIPAGYIPLLWSETEDLLMDLGYNVVFGNESLPGIA